MTRIYIQTKEIINRKEETEIYGEWSETKEIEEIGLNLEEGSEYISVDFEPIEEQELYLVKGVYSLGDSFGTSTGNVEYLDVFENEEKAIFLKEKIELFNELSTNNWYGLKPKEKEEKIKQLEFKLKGFFEKNKQWFQKNIFIYKNKKIHFPWGGYFEELEKIEVVKLKLKRKKV